MNIYVGNLSSEVSEADLTDVFGAFGQVALAKIVTDRHTNESKGFGFVEMDSDVEAKAAITALSGKELKGKALMVKEARPRRYAGDAAGSSRFSASDDGRATRVFVNNDVEKALRILKRKLSEDGDHRRLKERKHFTPRSQRRRKKASRAQRNRSK